MATTFSSCYMPWFGHLWFSFKFSWNLEPANLESRTSFLVPVIIQDFSHALSQAALGHDWLLGHLLHEFVVGLEVVFVVVFDVLDVFEKVWRRRGRRRRDVGQQDTGEDQAVFLNAGFIFEQEMRNLLMATLTGS